MPLDPMSVPQLAAQLRAAGCQQIDMALPDGTKVAMVLYPSEPPRPDEAAPHADDPWATLDAPHTRVRFRPTPEDGEDD